MEGEVLSVTAAAALLGVRPETVRKAAQAGRIAATKVGERAWVIARAEVERYGRERQGGGKTGPKPRRHTARVQGH